MIKINGGAVYRYANEGIDGGGSLTFLNSPYGLLDRPSTFIYNFTCFFIKRYFQF